MSHNRTEWVIHIWGKKRDTLELNDVEKFHIDILKMFQSQHKKFDKILVNIALDDYNDMNLFKFLKENIGEVLNNDNVEFLFCQNDPEKGEYVTFRPFVFDRIGEDVNIFYTHFKGYGTYVKLLKESYPIRIVDLCEKFWTYIMYRYSLDVDDAIEKLKDHCTYSWFVLKNTTDDYVIGYFNDYHKHLQSGDEGFKTYAKDDLHKHSPGSFAWYNMKRIGEVLKDEPLITSVSTDYLVSQSEDDKINLCTHFCESYLMQFLDEGECYSVKDFNKEISKLYNPLYISIYPAKTIGKEFINDFEKYLIEKGLI